MLDSNRHLVLHLALTALLTLSPACNQLDPPGTESDGTSAEGGGSDGDEYSGTLYPLADGATWTYVEKTTNGQVLGMKQIEVQEIVHEGVQAWRQIDTPNGDGEWDESVLTRDGTLVHRVHRERMDANGTIEIVDYDPGFARANDTWDTVGFSEEFLYDRTWTDGSGLNPVVEARGHSFTILAVDEQVTVPAGTFDCVKVERVRTVGNAAGERVIFWLAWGVGKVREENPDELTIEELASISIPKGTILP